MGFAQIDYDDTGRADAAVDAFEAAGIEYKNVVLDKGTPNRPGVRGRPFRVVVRYLDTPRARKALASLHGKGTP